MDFHEMTREELIRFVEEIKEKRAFSKEDQYLLKILDESPFTIWASDRDCVVRFWKGKCESLYGYREDDVIGKDFVDLFVAVDEQKAAREDQLKIIDAGEVFHNIANDHAKSGNTLKLLTNCWRMKALDSDEYWNVEMGLIIDYYKQEEERLNTIISESRLYKERTTQFIELTKKSRAQFLDRKRYFSDAIRACRLKAVQTRKATEFDARTKEIRKSIQKLDEKLRTLIEDSVHQVENCGSYTKCEELSDSFKEDFDSILDSLEDAIIDFEEIAQSFTPDGIIIGKENVLRQSSVEFEKYFGVAFELKTNIEHQLETLTITLSLREDASIIQHNKTLLGQVEAEIATLHRIQAKVSNEIGSAQNYQRVLEIRSFMCDDYNAVAQHLKEYDTSFKEGPST